MINQFRGEYRFLSNFYPSIVVYDNVYPTVEHFFQAMKTKDTSIREAFALLPTPGDAKKLGRKLTLREDWEQMKFDVMELGLRKKFSDPDLAKRLVETYPHDLIEGNWWNDKIWGICFKTNEGENHLGRILMIVRGYIMYEVPLLAGPDPVF